MRVYYQWIKKNIIFYIFHFRAESVGMNLGAKQKHYNTFVYLTVCKQHKTHIRTAAPINSKIAHFHWKCGDDVSAWMPWHRNNIQYICCTCIMHYLSFDFIEFQYFFFKYIKLNALFAHVVIHLHTECACNCVIETGDRMHWYLPN